MARDCKTAFAFFFAFGVELGTSWGSGRGVSEAAEAWESVMRLLRAVNARANEGEGCLSGSGLLRGQG